MEGLDETFDAVFFVGYHGSISGPPSALSHTYNPEVISGVRLAGRLVGESGINALAALACGVPIAFISGDSVTLDEADWFAPDVRRASSTKESVTRFAAHNLHPEVARERIRAGAQEAVERVQAGGIGLPPPRSAVPAARSTSRPPTWPRSPPGSRASSEPTLRSVAIEGDDAAAVYRSFVALTYITRQAGGR